MMMVKQILTFGFSAMLLASCTSEPQMDGPAMFTHAIPVDSANRMIGSFLNSIDYQVNDTDLFSIVVDAGALRQYLGEVDDGPGAGIKLMLAHNLDYINAGHQNQPVGFNRDALTVVIAAFDGDGNYVLLPGGNVMDYNAICPPDCPSGTAANPLIQ